MRALGLFVGLVGLLILVGMLAACAGRMLSYTLHF